MPDWKDLVAQLSGVRRGQRDGGRTANVSGYLVHMVVGEEWTSLTTQQRDALIRESVPNLRRQYESYLDREYRTMEAADLAMKDELDRLTQKYKPAK